MRSILILCSILSLLILSPSCEKKESDLYRIGMNPTWQPLNFQQSQGALNTFLAALFIDLAKKEGFEVALVNLPSLDLLFELQRGEVDGILTTLPFNMLNSTEYDISDTIIHLGPVLVVSNESGYKKVADLEGRIVGIIPFDRSVIIAQQIPNVVIRSYDNPILALEALENREIDGLLLNSLIADQLVNSLFKNRLLITTAPLGDEAVRLVVLHGRQKKLLQSLNRYITTLRNKDLYTQLKRNFFLISR